MTVYIYIYNRLFSKMIPMVLSALFLLKRVAADESIVLDLKRVVMSQEIKITPSYTDQVRQLFSG